MLSRLTDGLPPPSLSPSSLDAPPLEHGRSNEEVCHVGSNLYRLLRWPDRWFADVQSQRRAQVHPRVDRHQRFLVRPFIPSAPCLPSPLVDPVPQPSVLFSAIQFFILGAWKWWYERQNAARDRECEVAGISSEERERLNKVRASSPCPAASCDD